MGDQGQNVFVPIMTDKIGRNTAVGLVSAVDSCDDEAVKPGLITIKYSQLLIFKYRKACNL